MTRRSLVVLILGIWSLIGCPSAHANPSGPNPSGPNSTGPGGTVPDSLTLTGVVLYRERMALPPDAVLTVTLEDVSLADAPAVMLAQQTQALNGKQVPIPFSMVYPKSAVTPGATYATRARITQGDHLLFTTTERNAVDPLNPLPMELLVNQVPAAEPPLADVSLVDTYWKLLEVDGQPIGVAEQMREPHIVLQSEDSRFHGSGGVNQLMGGYSVTSPSLTFSQVASTMMAGSPQAMAQEQLIVGALGRIREFRIAGDQLTLVDDAGHPVIRAVAIAFE